MSKNATAAVVVPLADWNDPMWGIEDVDPGTSPEKIAKLQQELR